MKTLIISDLTEDQFETISVLATLIKGNTNPLDIHIENGRDFVSGNNTMTNIISNINYERLKLRFTNDTENSPNL